MSYTATRTLDELWLADIPEHWDSRKIKYTFSERVEKGHPDESLLVASQSMGVVPKDVYGNRTVEATKDLHNLKLVCVGDFVISLRSFQGGLEYAYYRGIISPAYTVMIPNDHITSGYFRFLAKSRLFIELLQMCVTGIREGQNIDYDKLKNHHIPLPPRDEQDQIVRYLDWKVSGINKLINAKRRQISLLQEKRRKTIDEIIGNAAGDKIRFRHLFSLYKGLGITKADLKDEGIPCVSYGEVHSKFGFEVNPDIHALKCVDESYLVTSPKSLLQYGDFVFADTSEDLAGSGNFTYLNSQTKAFAGYHTIIARLNSPIKHRYIAYYFDSSHYRSQIQQRVNGVKVYSITRSILNNTHVDLPDEVKQEEIIETLDKQCSYIDRSIALLRQELDLFAEYRTRLISDVVTGKLDVRGVIVPEYETIEDVTEDEDAADMENVEDLE